MEAIQDWAGYLFRNGYLTPGILSPLYTFQNSVQKYLLPAISRVIQKPDLASIALLLLILFLSLKLLNMLWNAVMFWVRLAFRIAFWGSAIVLALWIANRGVDGAAEDMSYWTKVWRGEYDYWKQQAESTTIGQRGGYKAGNARNQWW